MATVLVTVGSTSFDHLISVSNEAAFHVALMNLGYRHLVVQYGNGTVLPLAPSNFPSLLSCESFRYKPDLNSEMNSAQLVISHGGAGTCLQALTPPGSRRLIIVTNDQLLQNHQLELASKLAHGRHALLTAVDKLISLLQNGVGSYEEPINKIVEHFPTDVIDFLGPKLNPIDTGFVAFRRGSPERLKNYLDRICDLVH